MIGRRELITGLFSVLAAPAIVRASSLMPISVQPPLIIGHRYPLYPYQETIALWMQCPGHLLRRDPFDPAPGKSFILQAVSIKNP